MTIRSKAMAAVSLAAFLATCCSAAPGAFAAKATSEKAPAEKKTAAILPGGDSKKPINITAQKLDYFDKERKLIYTGNVVAIQGNSKLKSTVLTIFLAPKKAPDAPTPPGGQAQQGSTSNQVQHMYAKGPVTLLQCDQIGTGDNAEYDKTANRVVLTGNVTLSQGPNVTKGDRLDYDLKSGKAVVTGKHVESLFIPDSTSDQQC